ncbi:sulfotransferase [Microcoleus sp. FACHB-68]|nr:sulfotransferase [Microcoleus sp. FACHB-68]
MSQTLIITGMHRSGTSLTASFIQALGINLGENFFAADIFNAKGYFEDLDFLEFQRTILQNCCRQGEAGWTDWGWTESEWLDRDNFHNYIEPAKELIASRHQKSAFWGWKDPRTSLMLDFWEQLLPEARFLLVYRLPWDVADSILRLNSGIFTEHPEYPLKVWAFYNRHLLDFYARHSDRCILVNINTLLQSPTRLVELLETKLNLKVASDYEPARLKEIYDSSLFNSLGRQHPLVQLLQHIAPQYFSLLADLDRVADIPSDFSQEPTSGNISHPECLPLLLYRQAFENQGQLQNLYRQIQQDKIELESQIVQLKQENAILKSSKVWKLHRALSKIKKLAKIN